MGSNLNRCNQTFKETKVWNGIILIIALVLPTGLLSYEDTLVNETFNYPDGPLPEKFWSEGCQVEIKDGRLSVNANNDSCEASTVWLKQELSGNLSIEFDAQVLSSYESKNNINCFVLYSYPGDTSLWETREERNDGKYTRYHPLSGYIFTFLSHRGNEDVARFRLRDNPGFHLLDEYYGYECRRGKTYHIQITRIGNQLSYNVDGRKMIEKGDDQFSPVHEKGLFGFRTFRTEIIWDNLIIRRLY